MNCHLNDANIKLTLTSRLHLKYSSKLQKNVKCYRLNLFKEIIIDLNTAYRRFQNLFREAFSRVSLFELVNIAVTFSFSSSLVLLRVLLVSRSTVTQTC